MHYFTAEERRPEKWAKFVRRHHKGFYEYVEGHPFFRVSLVYIYLFYYYSIFIIYLLYIIILILLV